MQKGFLCKCIYFIRDELHQRLQIVAVIVFGSASTLPTWEDKKVEGLAPPSLVTRERTYNVTSVGELTSFQCCATRKEIVLIIHDLFGKYFNVSMFILSQATWFDKFMIFSLLHQ